jgi:hypothetical protein
MVVELSLEADLASMVGLVVLHELAGFAGQRVVERLNELVGVDEPARPFLLSAFASSPQSSTRCSNLTRHSRARILPLAPRAAEAQSNFTAQRSRFASKSPAY